MSRLIKIFLILLIGTIIFNKQILTFYYKNKLSKWVERPIHFKKVKINYPNNFEIEEIQIKNRDRFHYANIFEAEKIILNINFKSLFFSNLIIIKDLKIINPKFYLDVVKKKQNLEQNDDNPSFFDDNLGLAEKINEDIPDKIWPKKNKDINFLILKSEIVNANAYIKISSIKKPTTSNLSNMKFYEVGNEKNYFHYKEVLKLILTDMVLSTKDLKIQNILKEIYQL